MALMWSNRNFSGTWLKYEGGILFRNHGTTFWMVSVCCEINSWIIACWVTRWISMAPSACHGCLASPPFWCCCCCCCFRSHDVESLEKQQRVAVDNKEAWLVWSVVVLDAKSRRLALARITDRPWLVNLVTPDRSMVFLCWQWSLSAIK